MAHHPHLLGFSLTHLHREHRCHPRALLSSLQGLLEPRSQLVWLPPGAPQISPPPWPPQPRRVRCSLPWRSRSLPAAPRSWRRGDTNGVYEPCSDARIQRGDGFTFGLAFAGYNALFSGPTQFFPCDRHLNLASSAQLAVFRPKVDEISLLTINTTTGFNPHKMAGAPLFIKKIRNNYLRKSHRTRSKTSN